MASPGEAETAKSRGRRCPICDKPTVEAHAPFCSKRCAEVDLHRWLSGRYAIPAVEADDDGEEGSTPDDRND
ncbi:MAG: DNA gyrase inhibitor YacG [Bauldia sp.]